MTDKSNIFLIGPMGAGKSTIGRQLSQQLNMIFFDSDQEIEQRTGANIAWIIDIEGENGFREREKKIIKELTEKQKIILATGGGSIQSSQTSHYLSARGIVIYLKTTIQKQLLRTQYDHQRPLLSGIQPVQNILEKIASKRNPLYAQIADITICTDEHSVKYIVQQIINMLKNNPDILY